MVIVVQILVKKKHIVINVKEMENAIHVTMYLIMVNIVRKHAEIAQKMDVI